MTSRIVMSPERIQAALTEAERRMQDYERAYADEVEKFGDFKRSCKPSLEPQPTRRIQLPWKGCSTCRRGMVARKHNDGSHQFDDRTKGHFRSRGVFQRLYGDQRYWAWQCYHCNQTQASMTLAGWLTWLKKRRDPRVKHVAALIEHLKSIGLGTGDY